ncbi:MAG: PAS domain S-box protein, partial [Nitrospira sp.]|nr:PAS domain S-box protein [Nitrospira sp.]
MTENVATIKKKIKALIAFRALFVTLLLGSAFLFKAGYEKFPHAYGLSYLIVAMYAFTIVYSLLVEKIRRLVAFAYVQLMLDVVFGIVLIYLTGGIESWFSFALVLTIISSSIVLNRRAGYIMATLCSILYGILINLQFHKFLPLLSGGILGVRDYLYNIFIHILSCYLTAYLSGYLSSRLEKAAKKLDEKDINLRGLEFFNKEVIESLPSGLLTTDTSGKVIIFNKAAEKITGMKNDAVIGRAIDEVLPFFRSHFTGIRTEETIQVDGVQKVIGFQISPLRDIEGNDTGFIEIFQDVTEVKKLEAEMKRREKWA